MTGNIFDLDLLLSHADEQDAAGAVAPAQSSEATDKPASQTSAPKASGEHPDSTPTPAAKAPSTTPKTPRATATRSGSSTKATQQRRSDPPNPTSSVKEGDKVQQMPEQAGVTPMSEGIDNTPTSTSENTAKRWDLPTESNDAADWIRSQMILTPQFFKDMEAEFNKSLFEIYGMACIRESDGKETGRGYSTTGYEDQYLFDRLNELLPLGRANYQIKYTVVKDFEGKTSKGDPLYDVTIDMTVELGNPMIAPDGTNRFVPILILSGSGGVSNKEYASARKGAYTNAFKRCMAEIGLGGDAFSGELDRKVREYKAKNPRWQLELPPNKRKGGNAGYQDGNRNRNQGNRSQGESRGNYGGNRGGNASGNARGNTQSTAQGNTQRNTPASQQPPANQQGAAGSSGTSTNRPVPAPDKNVVDDPMQKPEIAPDRSPILTFTDYKGKSLWEIYQESPQSRQFFLWLAKDYKGRMHPDLKAGIDKLYAWHLQQIQEESEKTASAVS